MKDYVCMCGQKVVWDTYEELWKCYGCPALWDHEPRELTEWKEEGVEYHCPDCGGTLFAFEADWRCARCMMRWTDGQVKARGVISQDTPSKPNPKGPANFVCPNESCDENGLKVESLGSAPKCWACGTTCTDSPEAFADKLLKASGPSPASQTKQALVHTSIKAKEAPKVEDFGKKTLNQRILETKERLAKDDEFALAALLEIYSKQTVNEQFAGETRDANGVGFSGHDSEFLSSLAKQYKARSSLSPKQMRWLHKKMPKYARQLIKLQESATK